MKLTLTEPTLLKDSIGVISELVTEVQFKITHNAVELTAMDPANVAMVMFKLFSSAFVEYELDKDTDIAVNLDNLYKIMRTITAADTLTLELEEDRLKIKIEGESTRTFYLPILELGEREPNKPKLEFPVKITTKASILERAITDVNIVADAVSLIAEPQLFTLSGEGDFSRAKIDIKNDNNTQITMDGVEKVRARYSIEYLNKFVKAGKMTDKVNIMFAENWPLKLEFVVVDKLLLAFILAPRIEYD